MKTSKIQSALLLLALLIISACSEKEAPQSAAGKEITLTVNMPESVPETRLSYDDSKLHLKWDNGDKLIAAAFGADGQYVGQSEFSLDSGAGTSTGTFTGNTVSGAVKYIVYYQTEHLHLSSGIPDPVYTPQKESSGTTPHSHLKNYIHLRSCNAAAASGTEQFVSSEDLEASRFTMKMISSLLRLDIGIPVAMRATDSGIEKGVSKIVWTANAGNTPGQEKQIELTIPQTASSKEVSIFICFEDMDLVAGGAFRIEISNASGQKYSFEAESGAGKKYVSSTRYSASISDTQWTGVTL